MSPPRSSSWYLFWQWAQTLLLAANAIWTTVCLGGFLARTVVATSSLTAALLLTHAVGWIALNGRVARSAAQARVRATNSDWTIHPAGLWFIPFLIYAAANVVWISPVRWLGWVDWFNWLQLIVVFWVVLNGIRSRFHQRVLLGVLFALATVAVTMACYQRFVQPDWLMLGRHQLSQYDGRQSGPFGIPNSFAAFLLLLIPLSGALAARPRASAVTRVFFGWLTAVLLLGFVMTISRGAWISLGAALVAWPLIVSRASWWRRLLFGGAIGTALFAAVAALYTLSPTVKDRFVHFTHENGEWSRPILWRAAWKMFCAHPVVGTGGGSFDTMFEKFRPEGFVYQPLWAHNEYLNTLSDYGAVGFLLFFGAIGAVTWKSARSRSLGARVREPESRQDRTTVETAGDSRRRQGTNADLLDERVVRQAMAIGILAFGSQLFVDFHFKIPALAIVFSVVAGIAVAPIWKTEDRNEPQPLSRALGFAMIGVAIGIAVVFVPRYQGEALRQSARRIIDHLNDDETSKPVVLQQQLEQATSDLERAVRRSPGNAQAWCDLAYAAAQMSRVEPDQVKELGTKAEHCADRAIILGPMCAEFWVRRGVARDMEGKWDEAGEDFTKAISLSPRAVLPWFHDAYHLSLRRTEHDMAEALVLFCLRLDPTNRDALRLRQQLATGRIRP
jgi:O-antigen ligase